MPAVQGWLRNKRKAPVPTLSGSGRVLRRHPAGPFVELPPACPEQESMALQTKLGSCF